MKKAHQAFLAQLDAFKEGHGESNYFGEISDNFDELRRKTYVRTLPPVVWPQHHEGLIFIWANKQRPNPLADAQQIRRTWPATLQGKAQYNDNQSMVLDGGSAIFAEAGDPLLQRFQRSNAITIEAIIKPHNLKQRGPARIITFSAGTDTRNFTLGQNNERLVLRLKTSLTDNNGSRTQQDVAKLEVNRTHHVVVTYQPGQTTCYIDGDSGVSKR